MYIPKNISKVLIFLLISLVSLYTVKTSGAYAQQQMSLEQYIEMYKHVAMEEMRRHGIPASIKLAQGILESGFGNSDLAVIGNNHFGIKCHGWDGRTFYKDDDAKNECFRAYDDPIQSFRDHSEFLTTRERYSPLFDLDITDYRGWARGLRRAGYATNPRYPDLLIGVIERNSLYEFDRQVAGTLAARNPSAISSRPARNTRQQGTTQQSQSASASAVREIHLNNRVRYVYARAGDTPESIAEEMGMWPREIYSYNEMESSGILKPGQIVYLQPKRRRGSEQYHFVKSGETMYEISQQYAIRLSSLYRRNNMEKGQEPTTGQRIYLRGRARD
ncbi:MAG: glucosaminidase domain-containing protein [Bacteroidales bacterium]|nr:glucosaminidase domain-containing protein [Bacteroidales bacterium]